MSIFIRRLFHLIYLSNSSRTSIASTQSSILALADPKSTHGKTRSEIPWSKVSAKCSVFPHIMNLHLLLPSPFITTRISQLLPRKLSPTRSFVTPSARQRQRCIASFTKSHGPTPKHSYVGGLPVQNTSERNGSCRLAKACRASG